MPKMEKVRMAGIRYDKMKKHYENTLFDLTNEDQPQHALLTLVNGGGKGMFLQMLFQLMMPLTPWGKKGENHIDALFYNERQQFEPYTFHVAAEWRLDTDPVEWLITGICVTAERKTGQDGQTETEPQFFLYTGKFRKPFEWELGSLPFYDHTLNSAVEAEEWEQWLKKRKMDFQIYSKYKTTQYFGYLQNYGIQRSEWRHMRDINRDEGGIEHYFKNGLDNFGLFHHLIIPEISQYMQEEQTENLVKIFKDNAIIAQKLPQLLKREEAFQEIQQQLLPLKQIVEEGLALENRKKEHEELASYMYYGMEQLGQTLLQEGEKWSGEKERSLLRKRILLWEKENWEFAKATVTYLALQQEYTASKDQVDLLQQEMEEMEAEKKDQEISIFLHEHEVITTELEAIQQEITNLEQSYGFQEEKQQLTLVENDIQEKWKQAEEWICSEMGKYEALQLRLEKEIGHTRQQKEQMDEQRIGLESTFRQYTQQIRDHHTEAIKMGQKYGRKVNHDPESLWKENQKKIGQLVEDRKQGEQELQTLIETKESQQLRSGELVQGVKSGQQQLQMILKRKEQRWTQEKQFHMAWCQYRKEDSLFEVFHAKDMEQIENGLQKDRRHGSDQLVRVQKEIWKHQLDTALVHDDYWIPNDDLRKVKEKLEENQIPASYGSELIRNLSAEEQAELRQHLSLLPYGLVIHKRDWEKRVDSGWFSQTLSHSPVPIFIRENMEQKSQPAFEVFVNLGMELAYDTEKWRKWKENLNEQSNRLQDRLYQIQAEQNRVLSLLDQVKELQKESYQEIEREQKEKEWEIQECTEALGNLERQILFTSAQIQEAKIKLQENERETQNQNRQGIELEGWMSKHHTYQAIGKRKQQVSDKLSLVNRQIKECSEEINQLEARLETWRKEYWNWRGPINSLIEDLREVLPTIGDLSPRNVENVVTHTDPTLSQIETAQLKRLFGRWKQLHGQWLNRDSELIGFKKDFEYKNRERVKLAERLGEYDLQWMNRPVPTQHKEILLEQNRQLEQKLEEMKAEYSKHQLYASELNGQLTEAKKHLDTMEQKITEKFSQGVEAWDGVDLLAKQEEIEHDLQVVQRDLQDLERFLEEISRKQQLLKEQQRMLASHQTIYDLGEIPLQIRERIQHDPGALVREWTGKNRHIHQQIEQHQVTYKKGLRDLTAYVQQDKVDGPLRNSLHQMITHLETNSIRSSIDIVQSVMEYIHLELAQLKHDKEKSEQAKGMWVDRAVYRVISILSYLKRMVAKMRIKNQEGHLFSLVQIEGLNEIHTSQEEEYHRLLSEHFVKTIDRLLTTKEQIETLSEKELGEYVNDSQIVLVCLRNRYPTLSIYKPQTTNAFLFDKQRKSHFTTWETLNKGSKMEAKGSGGQLLAARTIIMMMIMTFKRQEDHNNWTVLIMDNPFGQAVSSHILDPIFSIADVLRFQWIVLAPPELIKLDVSRRFPVYWKLELHPHKRGEVVHEVLQHGGRTFDEPTDLFSWL